MKCFRASLLLVAALATGCGSSGSVPGVDTEDATGESGEASETGEESGEESETGEESGEESET